MASRVSDDFSQVLRSRKINENIIIFFRSDDTFFKIEAVESVEIIMRF